MSMDIPFSLPPPLVPLFIGLIALGVGALLVGTSNLIVRLLGVVLGLGGASLALTPIPNNWVSPGIKAIIVTIVFIGLSSEIMRSGWKKNRGATITGTVLVALGILALIVQATSYFAWPGGALQALIEQGFAALSRIFNLASQSLD
jgi:cation transport ATPase